jgi:hypothetical protein
MFVQYEFKIRQKMRCKNFYSKNKMISPKNERKTFKNGEEKEKKKEKPLATNIDGFFFELN